MYFKSLSYQPNPKSILKRSLEETMLLKAESDNVATFTLKLLNWNEITILQEFIVQNTGPPRNIAEKNAQQITEEPNGRGLIGFNPSRETDSSPRFLENVKVPLSSYSTPFKFSNYDYLKDNQVEHSEKIYYKARIV